MISSRGTLHNRFDFEIFDVETGETEHAQAENIVLNNMWTRLCGGNSYFSYIGVGTGSGTLSPARTTLFSYLASKSAVAVETVFDTETTGHVTKKITFSETEAIGIWTEIGIIYDSSSSHFVTHALITDSEGNPITINKTNTKIVTVYATVFAEMFPQENQYTYTGSKSIMLRFLLSDRSLSSMGFGIYNQVPPPAGEMPLGFFAAIAGLSWTSDVNNKRVYSNLVRFAVGAGNTNIYSIALHDSSYGTEGIGMVEMPLSGVYDGYTFTNVAVGTGDGVATEFDLPKSFPKPLSETIYVNGVAQVRDTDYQIKHGLKTGELWYRGQRPKYGGAIGVIGLHQPDNLTADGIVAASCTFQNAGDFGWSTEKIASVSFYASEDGIAWDTVVENTSTGGTSEYTYPMQAKKYRYVKWIAGSGGSEGKPIIKVNAAAASQKHIKFNAPPAAGMPITATFAVEYIPKSETFVLDLQTELFFGEEV